MAGKRAQERDPGGRWLVLTCCEEDHDAAIRSLEEASGRALRSPAGLAGRRPEDDRLFEAVDHALRSAECLDFIVLGHLSCPLLQRFLGDVTGECDLSAASREYLAGLGGIMQKYYPGLSGRERDEVLAQEHVLCRIEELLRDPVLDRAVSEGRLRFHGWIEDLSGVLHVFEPERGQFIERSATREYGTRLLKGFASSSTGRTQVSGQAGALDLLLH